MSRRQLPLFGDLAREDVASIYTRAGGEPVSNAALYTHLGIDPRRREPVGAAQTPRSLPARRARWYQQDLRKAGLIEPVPGERGHWRATAAAMGKQRRASPAVVLTAFSTEMGVALWSAWESVAPHLAPESVALALTSPPYPLRTPRAYGNPSLEAYVDWLCAAMAPVAAALQPGGTLALNVSNDIFEPGSPARSLYREKLVIALYERLGLSKLDELVWRSNKPPGPTQWASRTRQQLNVAWEPVYLFCREPALWIADNRRVLEAHSPQHAALQAAGGERRLSCSGDGAYRITPGAYGAPTDGRIPRNVLDVPNYCASQRAVKRHARKRGLRPHGAPMPLALADFLVRYLTRVDDLVLDPFAGSLTTGEAAERNGRRWICVEREWDYIAAGASRFH